MSEVMLTENEYIGEDGLIHCADCGEAKEEYYPEHFRRLGAIKHYRRCACDREKYEKEQAEREKRRHLDEVARLRSVCFSDRQMQDWTFANDNGRNPQMKTAHTYVDRWDEMRRDNQGLLLWGGVGAGKSFMAGCIANALIEKEIPVKMTNFAEVLNDLMGSYEGRGEYIHHLTNRYSLLIIDDFGMERGTEYGLEQVYNVIDSRWRAQKPLIVTTNIPLTQIQQPPDLSHQRIYDRIISMCIPVKVHGESLRKEQSRRNMDNFKGMLL